MTRRRVRKLTEALVVALLCFVLVTLLLSQVLPSRTVAVQRGHDDTYGPRPSPPVARPAPATTLSPLAADHFADLRRTPGKLRYPKAIRAKVGSLNIHEHPEENWQLFHNHISKNRLYDPLDPVIDDLLEDLQELDIVDAAEAPRGTQLKLMVTLEDGGQAMFKPMRFDREHARMNPNHFYFSDIERHNAEIAAYHLDRVLFFNRVPPTVGRLLNVTRDIERFAVKKLRRTFFISPVGNKCFHGNCKYYCDTGHAVCGTPELLEGSFQAAFPMKDEKGHEVNDYLRPRKRSPWRRSYSKHEKADWETEPDYCDSLKLELIKSRYLLDVMDVATFDFLQGNQDRHHIERFTIFANESAPVLFDNGRGFGRADFDDVSILAPVSQCCVFRYSTLKRLLQLHAGPKRLSAAFVESSRSDPVFPLLADDFVEALDRRLAIVLATVRKCVSANSFEDVVFDDGL